MSWRKRLKYLVQFVFYFLVLNFYVGPAVTPMSDSKSQIRAYTRSEEFDYVDWTIDALVTKLEQLPLDTVDYLDQEGQRQVIFDYLALIYNIQVAEDQLNLIYADPAIEDPETAAAPIRRQLDEFYHQRDLLGPLAESVMQAMLAAVAADLGFTTGGQPIPPVLYHSTPLPWALIVSPRKIIQQDADISLETSLTVEDHIRLEDQISAALDVATLVVPVGGVGTYPTMVAQTTNLNWLAEVVAHEWMHNYLTLRPLGVRYSDSPEMRTINETTASIAGTEIGAALIERFFPEFAPPPPAPQTEPAEEPPAAPPEPPAFDFRAEMHETRVTVDAMLADGKIEEAEAYMEARRLVFWENGYLLRKLNQAYFAFYGAYADEPGGQAGEDPVGAAVRQLRAESPSLTVFIEQISQVRTYADLLLMVQAGSS